MKYEVYARKLYKIMDIDFYYRAGYGELRGCVHFFLDDELSWDRIKEEMFKNKKTIKYSKDTYCTTLKGNKGETIYEKIAEFEIDLEKEKDTLQHALKSKLSSGLNFLRYDRAFDIDNEVVILRLQNSEHDGIFIDEEHYKRVLEFYNKIEPLIEKEVNKNKKDFKSEKDEQIKKRKGFWKRIFNK